MNIFTILRIEVYKILIRDLHIFLKSPQLVLPNQNCLVLFPDMENGLFNLHLKEELVKLISKTTRSATDAFQKIIETTYGVELGCS